VPFATGDGCLLDQAPPQPAAWACRVWRWLALDRVLSVGGQPAGGGVVYHRLLATASQDGWRAQTAAIWISGGSYIPGSAKIIASAGVTVADLGRWEGGIRYRYFGPRPLLEDGSVRSDPTVLVDARIGYNLTDSLKA
jgi:TonB dependent receptor